MAEIERLVIEETIARHGGSVPKAARILELSPSTIYRKLEAWGARD
jgi:DNA-binding NtrC family response regulator